jgi:hypothetical protein
MFDIHFRMKSARRSNRRARALAPRAAVGLERLEDRTLLSFAAPINSPTNSQPEGIARGDFRGVGTDDLVVANNGFNDGAASSLSLLLGNGDGTFQPAVQLDVRPNPFGVAVGDFNGDGHLDLVVSHANFGSPARTTVSVLLGNGDGTFARPVDYPVGASARSVAVGDFTGDGILDIVTANLGDNTVSVLLGNGDGTLQSARTFPVGPNPESVAVGRFGPGGHLGIVTADQGDANGNGGGVSLLVGNGDGTFQPAVTLGLGQAGGRPAARSVAVADLAGNGLDDIVTANDSDNGGTVSVLLANSDGSFQPAVTYQGDQEPLSVVAGNFHGDGHLDLVVANLAFVGTPDELTLFRGNGDGTFQASVAIGSGRLSHGLVTGDFNGDGHLDLAVSNVSGGDVSVLLGNGDGTFDTAPTVSTDSQPFALASGSFRRNGITDLVTANIGSNTVSVLLGNGDGTFQPAVNYSAGFEPRSVAVADVNGDDIPDLVVVDSTQAPLFQATVSVLLGNGDGTFGAPITSIIRSANDFPEAVAVGDLNGDRIPDLAVTDTFVDPQFGLIPEVTVLRGNGDGSFQPLTSLPLGVGDLQPRGVLIGNFSGNGFPGLAVTSRNGVSVIAGHGDGTFGGGRLLLDGSFPQALATGDFNGDGIPDLVASNFFNNTVSVFLGNGDGTYQPTRNYTVGQASVAVAVGDFTGDGVLDLAVANAASNTESVLRGNGDGTFRPAVHYLVGSGPSGVAVGDFNGDGSLDVAVSNSASGNVSLLLNRNDGLAPRPGGAAGHPRPAPAAPLRSDGREAVSDLIPPSALAHLAATSTPAVAAAPMSDATPVDQFLATLEKEERGAVLLLRRDTRSAADRWRWDGNGLDQGETLAVWSLEGTL